MEETFSPSQDMDMGSYWNDGKLLEEQDSLVETWTVIGESGLVRYSEMPIEGRINTNFKGSSTKTQK